MGANGGPLVPSRTHHCTGAALYLVRMHAAVETGVLRALKRMHPMAWDVRGSGLLHPHLASLGPQPSRPPTTGLGWPGWPGMAWDGLNKPAGAACSVLTRPVSSAHTACPTACSRCPTTCPAEWSVLIWYLLSPTTHHHSPGIASDQSIPLYQALATYVVFLPAQSLSTRAPSSSISPTPHPPFSPTYTYASAALTLTLPSYISLLFFLHDPFSPTLEFRFYFPLFPLRQPGNTCIRLCSQYCSNEHDSLAATPTKRP